MKSKTDKDLIQESRKLSRLLIEINLTIKELNERLKTLQNEKIKINKRVATRPSKK